MSLLPAALSYAAAGLRVFPQSPKKIPLIRAWPDRATADADEVRYFWSRFPDANVAVVCGAASGVFGLDVDTRDGRNGFAELVQLEHEHGPLPPTWAWQTPSGGYGFLFRYPASPIANRHDFRPGLEIHAARTAMTLPPSRRNGKPYVWTRPPIEFPIAEPPAWLVEFATPVPKPATTTRKPLQLSSLDRRARYVASAVNGECEAVSNAGAGGRNARLFLAAAKLGELVGAGLLSEELAGNALESAAHNCGLVQDDGLHAVRCTIRSGLQKGAANPRELSA